MQDVAADRDLQPFDPPEPPAHGERVEQGLGRMLAGAVAGVDHRAVHDPGDVGGGALGLVADDEDVGPHRVQGQRGVPQALALADAGGGGMEIGDLRAQPFARDLEGEERARAFSKKALIWVRPASRVSALRAPRLKSSQGSAASRIRLISAAERPSIPSR